MKARATLFAVLGLALSTGVSMAQQADPASYANYGAQLASQGKCPEALQYLEYAAAQNGALPGVWTRIGYCKESTGAKDAAVEAYKKAVSADPNDAYAKSRLETLAPAGAVAPQAVSPAPAATSTEAASGSENATEPAPHGSSASKNFKKFHVFLGGGAAMLVSPAGASDLFGTGYVGDLRFIYHTSSNLGFLLDLSAEGHVYITPPAEVLYGGGSQITSGGALAMVQTGLGGRYVIGGLAGKSVAPYVEGELVFTSAALAAVSTVTTDVYGNTVTTDAGVAATASGVGAGLAGGIALGKGFGGFLELGYRISGVDISAVRILAGLKF